MIQRRINSRSVENNTEIEKTPTAHNTTHIVKIESKFRPPQKMSYVSKFEKIEKAFCLYDIEKRIVRGVRDLLCFYILEKNVVKKIEEFIVFLHGLQIDIIKSMILASLLTALVALIIVLVIVLGIF